MRTRTIAALFAAGVVVLALGLGAGRGGAPSAGPGAAPPPAAGSPASVPARPATPARAASSTSSTSSTSPPAATSTTAPFARGRQQTDRLERDQPLAGALPHSTAHYAIDYRVAADGSLDLTVRLFAVLNDAGQLAQYEDQLRAYKAEALEFIRDRGGDPARYRVAFAPPEAARL